MSIICMIYYANIKKFTPPPTPAGFPFPPLPPLPPRPPDPPRPPTPPALKVIIIHKYI